MLEFWHFDRNTEVSPEQLGIYSRQKVWWQHICPTTVEEHEWQATVNDTYKAYMQDERLGRGKNRIYGYTPCPICWKRARLENSKEANKHNRKRLSVA